MTQNNHNSRLHLGVATLAVTLTTWAPVCGQSSPVAEATLPPVANVTRFSASLRGEPLQRLLSLLENTTPVKFRYGAPVDTLVTETFDNAPLWPSLEALLLKSGFHMRRSSESVFLFRNQFPTSAGARVPDAKRNPKRSGTDKGAPVPVAPSTTITPAAWQYWALSSSPPADWMAVQPSPQQPVLIKGANLSHGWRNAFVSITSARSPGITVALPATVSARYLRWPMKLRDIPLGAQLLVETSAPASLYVNGAAMFHRRSGRQLIDLSQVLRIGDNSLALQWEAETPPSTPGAGGETNAVAAAPTLQYEWFFSERKAQ